MIKYTLFTLFLVGSFYSYSQQTTTEMEKTINVSAVAERDVTPDEVVLYINVSNKEASFDAALLAMNKSVLEAKKILQRNNIKNEDIKTTNYSINKNYIYNNGKQKEDGYRAHTALEVRMPIETDKLSSLIKTFGAENPDYSLNFSFTISDKLKEKTNEELLTEATKRARAKATTIAKALGKEILDIKQVNFSEDGFSPYVPQFRAMMASGQDMMADEAMSAPIENVKDITLRINMNTIWLMN